MAFVGGMVVQYPTPPLEGSKMKKHDIGVQKQFFRAPPLRVQQFIGSDKQNRDSNQFNNFDELSSDPYTIF